MHYKMKSIEEKITNDYSTFKTPGAPLTNFNDGGGEGPTEVHILYQKYHNFRNCLPKKSLLF